MKLPDSSFASASDRAESARSQLTKRLRGFAPTSPFRPGGCIQSALQSAREAQSKIRDQQGRLIAAEDTLSKMLEQKADQIEKSAAKAGKRAAGRSESALSQIGRRAAERALREADDRVREESAMTAALDLITNREDAIYEALMGVLLQRAAKDLKTMEQRLEAAREQMRSIRSARDRLQSVRQIVEEGDFPSLEDPEEAADSTEAARRELSLANERYRTDGDLIARPIQEAETKTKKAARLLGGKALSGIIDDVLSGGNPAREPLQDLKEGREAIEEIPDTLDAAAEAYRRALRWGQLARLLPQTIQAVEGVAGIIKAGQQLRYLMGELRSIETSIRRLGQSEESMAERADLTRKLNDLAARIDALERLANKQQAESSGYQDGANVFRKPFFTEKAALDVLKEAEVYGQAAANAPSVAVASDFVGRFIAPTDQAVEQVQAIRREVAAAATNAEGGSALQSVNELLSIAGLDDPVSTIVSGKLPSTAQSILSGRSSDVVDKPEVCEEVEGLLPGDREYAQIATRDKRRQARALRSGPTQAMSEAKNRAAESMINLQSGAFHLGGSDE